MVPVTARPSGVVSLQEGSDAPDISDFAAYAGAALLLGFAMMALQTVLIRLGSLSFGASQFNFSMVVAVFVLCIALGSMAVSLMPVLRQGARGHGEVDAGSWRCAVANQTFHIEFEFFGVAGGGDEIAEDSLGTREDARVAEDVLYGDGVRVVLALEDDVARPLDGNQFTLHQIQEPLVELRILREPPVSTQVELEPLVIGRTAEPTDVVGEFKRRYVNPSRDQLMPGRQACRARTENDDLGQKFTCAANPGRPMAG